jgi:hypothetical protein
MNIKVRRTKTKRWGMWVRTDGGSWLGRTNYVTEQDAVEAMHDAIASNAQLAKKGHTFEYRIVRSISDNIIIQERNQSA